MMMIVCATTVVYAVTYDEALQQSSVLVNKATTASQLIALMQYVSQINSRVAFDFSLTPIQKQNYIATCQAIGARAENRLNKEFPAEAAQLSAQLNAQVMATMQSMMMQNTMNSGSFTPMSSGGSSFSTPRMNTKRYCPTHGEWDTRGGTFSCPGCMAPKFGF